MEEGYIDDLEHILGERGLQRVREQLELRATRNAHFVAEDDRGQSYDYSKEGFPPEEERPSAVEWLGVDSEHSW
jgi:hypothetical protein